jgi:hypothetical protein
MPWFSSKAKEIFKVLFYTAEEAIIVSVVQFTKFCIPFYKLQEKLRDYLSFSI